MVGTMVPACSYLHRPVAADGQAQAASMPATEGDPVKKPVILLVRMRLVAIEVPLGTVSDSEEIWSYLDEEKMGSSRTAGLGYNGLRVGVGKQSSWPDVARILDRLTGRQVENALCVMFNGSPSPWKLRTTMPIQTIFVTNTDRTLSGADYPPGDNILSLTCTLDGDDPSKVMVTGMPQINSSQQHLEIVQDNGIPTWQMVSTTYSFYPAMFRVMIPSKDFIVIGPGSESHRPHSVGNHFMVRQKKGMDFETVLLLIPEVIATN